MSVSRNQQDLRDMVDAIRIIIGKDPLYYFGDPKLMNERCCLGEVTLPATSGERQDWSSGHPGSPSTRDSFRDLSVGMALKRKALRFETQQKGKRA